MSALAPWLLSVLRIVTALLYIPHGTSKIFGFPRAGSGATVELYSLPGLAGSLEMVGGALILVGLFTRPVAFVLSGEMAFAYFMAHAPRNLHPMLNQGELPILFCFIYLYLAFAGAGPLSLDRLRKKTP
jgi:putative oxidoreductase